MNEDSALMGSPRRSASPGSSSVEMSPSSRRNSDAGNNNDEEGVFDNFMNNIVCQAHKKGPKYSFYIGAKAMLFDGPLNIFLVITPFAFISYSVGWPGVVSFTLAILTIAPFAERLGFVSEQLALHTNDTIGGLLNASFSNATELIIAITALNKGLFRVAQLSLLGSILSNLLLVLGSSFFFGGLYYKEQSFNKITSQVNTSMLVVAAMGILFPTVMAYASEDSTLTGLGFSRGASLVLFVMYCAFLYFQLISHSDIYDAKIDKEKNSSTSLLILEDGENAPNVANEEDADEDILGFRFAILWLFIITIFIGFLSDILTETIDDAADGSPITGVALAAVIIPVIGNVVEHISAITVSMKNKVDIAIGISVGSATQIAVFVLPLTTIVGWMINKDFSLNFYAYESICISTSVILATIAIKDGKSNWFIGLVLILAYFIVAIGFFSEKEQSLYE